MPEEGALIASGWVRDPDSREPVVLEQLEQVEGIAAIRLGLPHDHRADFRGVADHQRVAQLPDERVKPKSVSGALDGDSDRRGQSRIEALNGFPVMGELVLLQLAGCGIQNSHLLLAGVQVASYERHWSGPPLASAADTGSLAAARPCSHGIN
jgi:hypothetical protein